MSSRRRSSSSRRPPHPAAAARDPANADRAPLVKARAAPGSAASTHDGPVPSNPDMRELLSDLRDSWRGLRRDRLYAAAVIATLALTLGASVAVFSLVNGVLLRPLGYPDPGALVSIREVVPSLVERYPTLPATLRHFDVWRHRASTVSS